jgi:hypothetical protein
MSRSLEVAQTLRMGELLGEFPGALTRAAAVALPAQSHQRARLAAGAPPGTMVASRLTSTAWPPVVECSSSWWSGALAEKGMERLREVTQSDKGRGPG